MNNSLTCFIPAVSAGHVAVTLRELSASPLVQQIFLLVGKEHDFSSLEAGACVSFEERDSASLEAEACFSFEERCPAPLEAGACVSFEEHDSLPLKCPLIIIDSLTSSKTVKQIANHCNTEFALIYTKYSALSLGYFALERFLSLAQDSGAGMVYSDHYQLIDGKRNAMPLIAYQEGSLRDDFNFGSLLFCRSSALKSAAAQTQGDYPFAGLYYLRLALSRIAPIMHINEYLYTEVEHDTRKSGQKLFDYVDPKNRAVQIDMERACTEHLKAVGGYLEPLFMPVEFDECHFEYEASVIIPVYNRVRTIKDAIRSVWMQQTTFPFNLIIVDNHSTDGTSEVINQFKSDNRLIHIIPARQDLGIGGCWNLGVHHPKCGKFAIQLDSDDLYADESALTKMVNAFYEQKCAMVVGTYRMTNFELETIPPGIIDHKEWTPENGRNNALRINGLGAPRAFYTPILRKIKLPNTSYGEDYALGLRFSRHYQIGRVYDVVYCCRRWEGNSDSALDVVKQNAHNLYKDRIRTWELQARRSMALQMNMNMKMQQLLERQMESWPLATENYRALEQVEIREIVVNGVPFVVQFNPARMASSTANIDPQAIKERPCFLCGHNLPFGQEALSYRAQSGNEYMILCNPFPIFPRHFTIPDVAHTDQLISGRIEDMLEMANQLQEFVLLYNGPRCAASAPDHFHFQAGDKGFLPLQVLIDGGGSIAHYPVPAFVFESEEASSVSASFHLLSALLHEAAPQEPEPMFNLLCWKTGARYCLVVFPRKGRRPTQFYAEGADNILISPGSVDLGGVWITPLEKDFRKLTEADIADIINQLSIETNIYNQIANRISSQL